MSAVHFATSGSRTSATRCYSGEHRPWLRTLDPERVTCGACIVRMAVDLKDTLDARVIHFRYMGNDNRWRTPCGIVEPTRWTVERRTVHCFECEDFLRTHPGAGQS